MRWFVVTLFAIGCIDYNQEVPGQVVWPPHESVDPMEERPGEDVIITPEQGPVDLLVVVDDSCSMTDDQATLLVYAPKLILPMLANNIWFHFGVTTTDGREPQVGIINWIDSETSDNPVEESSDLLNVGIHGSGEEQGKKATWFAFKKQFEENLGFFRPDAALHLIYISDERDQTAAWASERFDKRVSELAQWRGQVVSLPNGAPPFSISAIVETENVPVWESPCAAEYAPTYMNLALDYPGEIIPICSLNWTAAIDRIAQSFVDPQTVFPLEEHPVPGTLAVLVQYPDDRSPTGVTTIIPDPETWDFLESANAVVFNRELFPTELLHTVILTYTVEYY